VPFIVFVNASSMTHGKVTAILQDLSKGGCFSFVRTTCVTLHLYQARGLLSSWLYRIRRNAFYDAMVRKEKNSTESKVIIAILNKVEGHWC
jgi:hypothetical protein